MKRLIIGLLLLTGMALATDNYSVRVPVGASYSDGGVWARPTADTVKFWAGSQQDSLIKAIVYTADSMGADSALKTVVYCTTGVTGIIITHHIVYPSGNTDFVVDYYEPRAEPNASGAIYRMYVGVIDTSATPDDTTYPSGSNVTFRYYLSTRVHFSENTNSSGYVEVPVMTPPIVNSSIYSVVASRAGCAASAEAISIDTATDYNTSVLGYSFRDTMYVISSVPTSMCAVYLTMTDFGYDEVANVKVTARCKRVFNTCTDTWYALNEEVMGYTNSDGYLSFNVPRSSCISNSKIEIFKSYGNEPVVSLGKFTIPDSTTYKLMGS